MTRLRVNEIFNDARLRLIAVESVDFQHSKSNACCLLSGNIKPVAVIICGPGGAYALDMEAKPITSDQLRQDIPELDSIISRHLIRQKS